MYKIVHECLLFLFQYIGDKFIATFLFFSQVGFVCLGYFFHLILHAKWLCFVWSMMAIATFLLAMFAYFIHYRFTRALKALGYLLTRHRFQTLRRIPFFIAAFCKSPWPFWKSTITQSVLLADVLINLAGFSTLALLCPGALSDPANSSCQASSLLNRPYRLLYFIGVVGQAGLLIIFHAVLCISLISFHRQALRGRVLPDVLSELAQLSASTVLAGQDRADLSRPMFTGVRGPETINSSGDVAETHSRIVNIMWVLDHDGVCRALALLYMYFTTRCPSIAF